MTSYAKTATLIFAAAAMLLLAAAPDVSAQEPVVVGGKNFTEQYLLPNLAALLLEDAGIDVELQTGVGSAVARRSLENGQIDMYYEYTGTAYTVFYKKSDRDVMTDEEAVYEWVKAHDAEKGLIWLDPVQFNNTYTLMMREKQAERLGIETISDLSEYIGSHPGDLVIGVNAEFWERPDGFKPLMKTYDFRVPYEKVRKMDSGLVYKALRDKNVDVSMGFATDGRIDAFGFVTLEDDKDYFPVYNPAPVVREEVLKQYPKIEEILEPLAEKLTTREMQQLNAVVDIQHKGVEKAARAWLKKMGLL